MKEKLIPFTHNDYEIVKRDVLYEGIFRVAKYEIRHLRFNGTWTNVFKREIFERPSAVGILPYDPVLNQVILIQQFRAGALADPKNPWLVEIVAGLFNAHEKPQDVAIREAKEEAGCEILDILPICEYFVSPGGCNEYLQLYCGRVDTAHAGGIYGLQEENEDIRVIVLTLDEALAMLQAGKIKTSPAIISLQWLQLNQNWLKQLWSKK